MLGILGTDNYYTVHFTRESNLLWGRLSENSQKHVYGTNKLNPSKQNSQINFERNYYVV